MLPPSLPSGQSQHESKIMLRKFLNDESGATAIEYGLIAALVAVAIIGALGALGDQLVVIFDYVTSTLQAQH